MYTVVYKKGFRDLKDTQIDNRGYIYSFGSEYPRTGFVVSKKRLEELSSKNNKIGEILIALEVETLGSDETPSGEASSDKDSTLEVETPGSDETPSGEASSDKGSTLEVETPSIDGTPKE